MRQVALRRDQGFNARLRAKDTSDDELSLGELLAEHAHERDLNRASVKSHIRSDQFESYRATLAHVVGRVLTEVAARLVERGLEPRDKSRRLPAGGSLEQVAGDLSQGN